MAEITGDQISIEGTEGEQKNSRLLKLVCIYVNLKCTDLIGPSRCHYDVISIPSRLHTDHFKTC